MRNLFHDLKFFEKKNKGFAILFAVLVASILLSIGISIFNLTIKELALSSSGRESAFAFYAADSGAECAHYWDITPNEGVSPFTDISEANGGSTIYCGGSITLTNGTNGGTATSTTFNMDVDDTNHYCAVVVVSKTQNPDGSTATLIASRGYNICTGSAPDYGDQDLVERGLQLSY